mgnify:CR=1 FL=1
MLPLRNSKHRLIIAAVFLSSAVFNAGRAAAETAESSTPPLPLPHPKTILLRSPEIHRELKLDEAQLQAIASMMGPIEHGLWMLRDQPPEVRSDGAPPLLDQLDQQLAEILTNEQKTRFQQILRQSHGLDSMRLPDVVEELELSQQQVTELNATLDQHFEELRGIEETGQQYAVAVGELRERTRRALQELLDTDQQAKLAELYGPTIDLSAVKQVACLAPELRGVNAWLQSEPLSLQKLRGKVVVLHFYAHMCINCQRNLPHYNKWFATFPQEKVQMIGIHRPEFDQERDAAGVLEAARASEIAYPIALDNQSQNWNAWANNMWPSVYLIDKNGYVRSWWYGELNWQGATGEQQMAAHIPTLIDE